MTALPAPAVRPVAPLRVLLVASAIGIAADALLRAGPWGVNVAIGAVLLVTATGFLVARHRAPLPRDAAWLGLTIVLLAAAFVRRDSATLSALDLLALIAAFGAAPLALDGALRRRGVTDYAATIAGTALAAWIGIFGFAKWARQSGATIQAPRLRGLRGATLGVALAAPLLVIFAALFASADPIFASVVSGVTAIDLTTVVSHVAVAGLCSAFAAGYLRRCLEHRGAPPRPDDSPSLGIVPVGTALALVNFVFLVFVVVQARYFFGGAALVGRETGLTYAAYARSGFFQLMWAAALVLPVLLGGDWLVRHEPAAAVTTFRRLAVLLLVQLAVVVASAFQRMRLYVGAYGLSETRFFATAGMTFVAALLLWFAASVLAGKRARFAFGAVVAGLGLLTALNVADPDALIVRYNLDQTAERPFDADYAVSLGGDAVPALLPALPRLDPPARCRAARRLVARWGSALRPDWRTWTRSRGVARSLVRTRASELLASCASEPTPARKDSR
ncbi:MAG TPA: DUF4173 domain-containing protein [Gemmatimonadales bacterium]|nr:DUF4173 domain-containing protein [Gemmatimonadales bacterium]